MKYLLFSLLINLVFFSTSFSSDCKFAKAAGEEAFSYMMKALDQDNLDNAKFYYNKARQRIKDYSFYTQQCGCIQCSLELQKASHSAQRAVNAIDIESFLIEHDSCFRYFIYSCELYNICISKK